MHYKSNFKFTLKFKLQIFNYGWWKEPVIIVNVLWFYYVLSFFTVQLSHTLCIQQITRSLFIVNHFICALVVETVIQRINAITLKNHIIQQTFGKFQRNKEHLKVCKRKLQQVSNIGVNCLTFHRNNNLYISILYWMQHVGCNQLF